MDLGLLIIGALLSPLWPPMSAPARSFASVLLCLVSFQATADAQQLCLVGPGSERAPQWDDASWDVARRSPAPRPSGGCRVLDLYEGWDGARSAWAPVSRRAPVSGDDNSVRAALQQWDGQGWANSARESYRYDGGPDGGGPATEFLFETWSNASWADDYRFLYGYDAAGNATSRVRQGWHYGTVWENTDRALLSYDGDGNRVEYRAQHWDRNESVWEGASRTVYRYDAGAVAGADLQEWDGSEWTTRTREVYAYEGGTLTETVRQVRGRWDGAELEDESRDLYRYDDAGNLVERVRQKGGGGEWSDASRDLYHYDEAGNLTEHILQSSSYDPLTETDGWGAVESREAYSYGATGDLVEHVSQRRVGGELTNTNRRRYEYALPTAAGPSSAPAALALSVQNPLLADGHIRYTTGAHAPVRLALYDLLGREVVLLAEGVRPPGSHGATLRVNGLAPGTYVLRLQAGDEVQARTLTVVR